jgi:hypothetical protein
MTHESKPKDVGMDGVEAARRIVERDLGRPVGLTAEQAERVLSMASYSAAADKFEEFALAYLRLLDEHPEISDLDRRNVQEVAEGPDRVFDVVSPPVHLEGVDGVLEILDMNNVVDDSGNMIAVWLYLHPSAEEDVYEGTRYVLLVPEMPALSITRTGLGSIASTDYEKNSPSGVRFYYETQSPGTDVQCMTSGQLAELFSALQGLELRQDFV